MMPNPERSLTREEITRYSRHLLMPEIGTGGQQKLGAARVLCVGAGGLGSPVSMYLAAAGVGRIGLVDFDRVDVTNLQRQLLYRTSDVGRPKLDAATERLRAINPLVEIVPHQGPLTSTNALDILGAYDIVVDATDNFPARYLVNDACLLLHRPYVYGSVFRFEGQVSVFATPGGPCYRCLFPEPPEPGLAPSCSEAGVLGVLPGLVGTIQAIEAIKQILGTPDTLAGRVLMIDALRMRFREVRLARDRDCPACGDHPSVRGLIDYDEFCGLTRRPGAGLGAEPAADDEMTVDELKRRLDGGDPILVIDVREPLERTINGLPGAVAIRMTELAGRLGELPRDRDVVVFCRVGERSRRAVKGLRDAGVARAYNLRGGILAWIEAIDPSMPRY